MNKYCFLVKIEIKEFNTYIEVGKQFELNFHPNITDQIEIADYYFCKIKRIKMDISYKPFNTINLIVEDPLYRNVKDIEHAIKILRNEYKELEKDGWYANDWTHNILGI